MTTEKKSATPLLRNKAEQLLKDKRSKMHSDLSESERLFLIHELEVHQIELELQNEELKLAQKQILDQAAEKYTELYDFAPIGYFTLSQLGEILMINLAGAAMLGKERMNLIHNRFSFFLAPASKPIFNKFLDSVLLSRSKELCEVELSVRGKNPMFVQLNGISTGLENQVLVAVADITEHKLAEKTLQESEARFRNVLQEVQSVSVQGYGPDGTTQYWNRASEKMYGYSAEEAIGRNLLELIIPPEMRDEVGKAIIQMTKTGQPVPSSELLLMRKDGSRVPVYSSHAIIHIPGNPQELFCIDIDLTERKKAEAALIKSEEKYRQLYESIKDAVFFIDIEGRFLRANAVFLDMLGYTKEELVSKTYRDLTPEKWQKTDDEFYINQIKERGYTDTYEKEFIRKDGSLISIEIRGFLIMDDNGHPAEIWAIVRDITERKQADQTLKESEQRLRSLVEILQFTTENIHELLDFTLVEAIELTSSKLGYIYFYHEQKKEFTLHAWSQEVMNECFVLEKKTTYKLEETGIWGEAVRQRKPIIINDFHASNPLKKGYPEGHAPLIRFLTIPVIIDNAIVAVIGMANKDTEYKESDILHLTLLMDSTWKTLQKKSIESLIKKQNEELLKLNADKDRFISILGHDLKNPFSSILGFLNLLTENVRKYDLDKVERLLSITNDSAMSVFNLLEDITMWARSQAHKLTFEPQELNFSEVYQQVVADMKLTAENKGIVINQGFGDGIGIFADVNMLKTILRNLISNAIKFTSFGGRIDIDVIKNTDTLTVEVSDNGVGISAEAKSKLFEISEKYSTKGTMGESGTGLGLLLCKDFVEKHNGKIWVETEQGKGSKFKFMLPVDPVRTNPEDNTVG